MLPFNSICPTSFDGYSYWYRLSIENLVFHHYDTCDYPLVHHAWKFGLRDAVDLLHQTGRTNTESDDYMLQYSPSADVQRV
jgi:hypothetical protein